MAEKGHHKHDDGSATRAFTVEQKAAVLRVRRCKATDFYDILGLQEVRKTCSDGEIKKAYRKLSLLTHPDKNGYDGADEAFKMVSRAFQVLSDADKKQKYDKFGGDPDSRFGSASASAASGANPFAGFASQRAGARPGGAGFGFEEEISPEELFRQFFGGGMGGPFGGAGGGAFGGPGFMFNMGGGPGIRIHQFGGAVPRRRPHNHEDANPNAAPASPLQALQGLLPLILLVLLPILSALFSGASGPSGPQMRFDAAVPPLTQQHTSGSLKVPYWVNPIEVKDFSARNWKEMDRVAEQRHVQQLSSECEWEQNKRHQLAAEAQGFFYTDQVKLERARSMDMPSCKRLKGYGKRLPSVR